MDQDIKDEFNNIKIILNGINSNLDDLRTAIARLKTSQDYLLNRSANIEIQQEDNNLEIISIKRDINRLSKRVLDLENK